MHPNIVLCCHNPNPNPVLSGVRVDDLFKWLLNLFYPLIVDSRIIPKSMSVNHKLYTIFLLQ